MIQDTVTAFMVLQLQLLLPVDSANDLEMIPLVLSENVQYVIEEHAKKQIVQPLVDA